MTKLWELEKSVREELKEQLFYDGKGEFTDEPHDIIHEIADTNVPVYTSDLMQLATENISLATDEPELGPAFDGSPTPVNIVAANVYEYLQDVLWEEYEDIKTQLEEEKLCRFCGSSDLDYIGMDVEDDLYCIDCGRSQLEEE